MLLYHPTQQSQVLGLPTTLCRPLACPLEEHIDRVVVGQFFVGADHGKLVAREAGAA